MHEVVSFNSVPVSVNDVSVSALSAASIYGKGIFTTVAITDGTPFLWDKHWRRLNDNAMRVGIDLRAFPEPFTREALDEIIVVNKVTDGRARITFFDQSSSHHWPFEADRKTALLITTADTRAVPGDFRVTASPFQVNSRSPIAGIKSCNYLEKLMALDDARSHGFDEAIQINEHGQVASAVMANVFWLSGGQLYTPSLKTGCLAGTTREFVMENLQCGEVDAGIEELDLVESIFLTSAGIRIVAVSELDGRRFTTAHHPIMDLVKG